MSYAIVAELLVRKRREEGSSPKRILSLFRDMYTAGK